MTSTAGGRAGPALEQLPGSAQRVNRSVDGLQGDDWAAPSLLPGWSRAHVAAHLALNAEAMIRAVHGLLAGDPAPMYDSDEHRDRDIEALAREHHDVIRDRLLGATTVLHDAFAAIPDAGWDDRVDRTPGGRSLRVTSMPGMRLREMEIHHVDLALAYTTADWSGRFSELLLDAMTRTLEPTERLELRPTDLERTWVIAPEGAAEHGESAVVTGPAADLGWWLTGRPAPETLTSTEGRLPEIGAW